MVELFKGVGDVARGGRFLLAHPRLLVWVVAPAVITLLVIAAVVWGVLALSDPAVAWVAARVPESMAGWVSGIVRVLVVAALATAGFLVFVTIAGLLAGPFCELLSEAIESIITGRSSAGFSPVAFGRGLVVGLVHAIRRLLVYLVGLVLVFLLGALIPVVGPIVAVAVGWFLAASGASYDCYDAVFSRRLWAYRRKLDFLRAHRGRTLGLGAAVAALLIVPGVNLFALGLGAAGATLTALDLAPEPPAAPRPSI